LVFDIRNRPNHPDRQIPRSLSYDLADELRLLVSSSGSPCPTVASAEKTATLTPDVVTFKDAPGVTGSGAGSGGSFGSLGAAIYPQLSYGDTSSVSVSQLSCTLPAKQVSLCRAVEGDFLVRNTPMYIPQSSG
jgi:hypothetical protein